MALPVGTHRRPSLTRYLGHLLGHDGATQLRNWLRLTWGAPTFRLFWRYWNPVYGYFLYYYAFRPLRTLLPATLATLCTFALCGFLLHDLIAWGLTLDAHFPFVALTFTVCAAQVIAADALGLNLSRRPFALRAAANLGHVALAVVATLTLRSLFA